MNGCAFFRQTTGKDVVGGELRQGDQQMKSTKMPSRLLAIGGAEDKTGEQTILKKFVELSAAKNPNIVVMTTATELPGEVAREYIEVFKRLGVKDVRAVDVSARADALKSERIEASEQASAVFLPAATSFTLRV